MTGTLWQIPSRSRQPVSVKATRTWLALLALGTVLGTACLPAYAANKSKLSTYQSGKPVVGLPCGTQLLRDRTAVLMGGGTDVKGAYTWMINKMGQCADGSTGKLGNFLVIRAGGNPDYDRFIYKLGPVASVETIVVPTVDSANDPEIEAYIRNAGAIWLTGGDQGDYYNFWKGTLLERLVSQQVATYGIPIGGTSAGMMILSEFNYIADPYSVTSPQALADPYLPGYMTLKNDFWTNRTPFPPLLSTVTDSHFDTRDRMGRLVAFMARTLKDGWARTGAARAIGVDQETALLFEYSDKSPSVSTVTTIANPDVAGAGYVLSAGSGSTLVVEPGKPLTFTNIQVRKLPVGAVPVNYQINVIGGVLTSSNGSIY